MKIRLLTQKDIPAASAIVGINYSKKYEKSSALELMGMFSNAAIRPVYYVAEDEGKIIGLAGFTQSWMDYDIYQIFWVNVTPIRQGEGIGKKLVAKVLTEIRKHRNVELIQLTATHENVPFYKKHFGFKISEEVEGSEYVLMSLHIKRHT